MRPSPPTLRSKPRISAVQLSRPPMVAALLTWVVAHPTRNVAKAHVSTMILLGINAALFPKTWTLPLMLMSSKAFVWMRRIARAMRWILVAMTRIAAVVWLVLPMMRWALAARRCRFQLIWPVSSIEARRLHTTCLFGSSNGTKA